MPFLDCNTVMKTIIFYATKHGAAGEIARRIADKMDGAVMHDLKQGEIPSLNDFDRIIIGSSIYAGTIRREAKAFLSKNAGLLREKKPGLFLCGMDTSRKKKYFDANFPPDMLQTAKTTGFLGGIFDPKKAGILERLIMKAVAKQSVYMNTIDDAKIERFVTAMNA
ncbi:MAG: flavodoxin domain-containing protein [Treponema sp.]|nr:flavodoxin domain-containing protein [Treponema sp.]